MSKKTLIIFIALVSTMLAGCLKDTHFGKSDYNLIKSFTVPSQIGTTIYEGNNIYIAVDLDYDVTNVTPLIQISNFASITPQLGTPKNFSSHVTYTVTSESGISNIYNVWLYKISPEIQLPNSDFQQWHFTTTSNKTYMQIGRNTSDTIWATSNAGAASIATPNVIPTKNEQGDTIPELQTLNTGKLAQLIGQGIAAGSLFTGTFKLNLSDPIASAKFGTPFVARPKSFSVTYKYAPGTTMLNGKGVEIEGQDSLDIYALLEDRSTTPWKRVATAWFRSSTPQPAFVSISLNFSYGKLPNPKPYEVPKNGVVWGNGSEKPTHISVVFTGSARGDFFEGAPGSTLWVTNFKLNY